MRERGRWRVFVDDQPSVDNWWSQNPSVVQVLAIVDVYRNGRPYFHTCVAVLSDGTAEVRQGLDSNTGIKLPTRRAALKLCRTMNALIDSEK